MVGDSLLRRLNKVLWIRKPTMKIRGPVTTRERRGLMPKRI
jgi:hypothetical protein